MENYRIFYLCRQLLIPLYKLFIVDALLKNVGFLAVHVLSKQELVVLQQMNHDLVKEIGPLAKNLSDSLGVHESMIKAPIAHDWIKYNTFDNFGELSKL